MLFQVLLPSSANVRQANLQRQRQPSHQKGAISSTGAKPKAFPPPFFPSLQQTLDGHLARTSNA